ncbi:MAG: MarR family transcriptional regulator [Alphaproteobacteria bacterium]|nr:MarR family transcriptional regulator [Alphaproteobacteria bacterium]
MALALGNPHALRAATIREVQEAARAVTRWTEQDARLLDQGVKSHVLEALVGCTDPDVLFDIRKAVLQLVRRADQAVLRRLDRDWIERWEGWAALLDLRAAQLLKRATSGAQVASIKHVPQILALVRENPGSTQRDIARRLDLTAPNVTRLLRILEDSQLIERRKCGNAKVVYLREDQVPEPASALADALRARNREIEPMLASIA